MSSRQDIVCFSSIDWDFIWQGHQEIMATLAEQGHRVLFIENTGVRNPSLQDLPRLRRRLLNWLRGTKGFRQERENLFIYSPLLLPFPYSRIAGWVNRGMMARALQRWMQASGFRRPIMWTFLPTPLARELIRELKPALAIYYCIDDLAASSPAARRLSRSELRLFQEADLVFVTSEKLEQRASRYSSRVHLFPFGVDFGKFDQVRQSADNTPTELRKLPHPVVGYVGGVHRWVDQKLLADVVREMPEASFVFVGPPQTDTSRLTKYPNVYFLGARPHDEIPCYIKGFDVGIVPYCPSQYTDHVYPTKLNEYLAMGIPVVATDLPEIRRFNVENGQTVTIARDAVEFAHAIQKSCGERGGDAMRQRIQVAQRNSWEGRIATMLGLIEHELATRRIQGEQWKDSLRRLYRRARHRLLRMTVVVVTAYAVLFHSPFIWYAAEPLRLRGLPQPADAIVVFAGGVGESGQAGQGYQERVEHAVSLYRQGFAPLLLFSSGYRYTFKEAEVMKVLAESMGVPATAIILEELAGDTRENVRLSAALLRNKGCDSALVVSSPYHMRRVSLVWRKEAPDISATWTPIPHSRFFGDHSHVKLRHVQAIAHEYLGILYYWWKGWM